MIVLSSQDIRKYKGLHLLDIYDIEGETSFKRSI